MFRKGLKLLLLNDEVAVCRSITNDVYQKVLKNVRFIFILFVSMIHKWRCLSIFLFIVGIYFLNNRSNF